MKFPSIRSTQIICTILGVVLVLFSLNYLIPASLHRGMVGEAFEDASEDPKDDIRTPNRLDRPLPERVSDQLRQSGLPDADIAPFRIVYNAGLNFTYDFVAMIGMRSVFMLFLLALLWTGVRMVRFGVSKNIHLLISTETEQLQDSLSEAQTEIAHLRARMDRLEDRVDP